LGPSGCGKTTLLRLIAGFEQPDAGRIRLAGADVTDLPPYRRNVTTVFQQYALFPHMTVFDNVAFGLRRRGLLEADVADRVGKALDLVRLEGMAGRMPAQLSGGQQQRTALARSLVLEPPVLLLDEPLAALDRKLREQMRVELKAMQRRLGISFVFVTHDQDEALAMSDRVVVMNVGRIEQIGAPEQVYERPRTRFVADFIGSGNIFAGEPAGAVDGATLMRVHGATLPVAGRPARPGPVNFVVRAERLRAVPMGQAAGPAGTVEHRVYLGDLTQWQIRLADGRSVSAVRRTHDEAGGPSVGDRVTVTWSPESAVLLED
jgi:spermidine/putrescine ABC transporter ATP-binding subunit